jgi:hypothetical protein
MYFRVNGVAMFLKGANLIPFHTVRTKATHELMMSVLNGALDGGRPALGGWEGAKRAPGARRARAASVLALEARVRSGQP